MNGVFKRLTRIALAVAFAFIWLNGFVGEVVKERSWFWALAILGAVSIAVAVDRVVLWLYMKYSSPALTVGPLETSILPRNQGKVTLTRNKSR